MGRKVKLLGVLKKLPTKYELDLRRRVKAFEESIRQFTVLNLDLTKETDFNKAVEIFKPSFDVERAVYLKNRHHYMKAELAKTRNKAKSAATKVSSGKLDEDVPDTVKRKPTKL